MEPTMPPQGHRSSVTTTSTTMPDGTTMVESITKTVNADGSITEEVKTWSVPPGHGARLGEAPPSPMMSVPHFAGAGVGGGGADPTMPNQTPTQQSMAMSQAGPGQQFPEPQTPQQQRPSASTTPQQSPAPPYATPQQSPAPPYASQQQQQQQSYMIPPPQQQVSYGGPPAPHQSHPLSATEGGLSDEPHPAAAGGAAAPAGAAPGANQLMTPAPAGNGGAVSAEKEKTEWPTWKKAAVGAGIFVVVAGIAVGVAVPLSKRNKGSGGGETASQSSSRSGPAGFCDLDGIDRQCFPGRDSSFELCFDENADGTACSAFVVDTSQDNFTWCCDGCAVCPFHCGFRNAYDCTNLNETITGPCNCSDGFEPPFENVANTTTTAAPTASTPQNPFSPSPATTTPVPPTAPVGGECGLVGGADPFCQGFEDGSGLEICVGLGGGGDTCEVWFKDANGNAESCCDTCSVCPAGCENNLAFDCGNLDPNFVFDCDCGADKCDRVGGADPFCQGGDDGTGLEICVDISGSGDTCSVWFLDTTENAELCCQGCTICPAGCNNTLALDCGNLSSEAVIDCGCG